MPELPEVETVARDLQPYVGSTLQQIQTNDARVWFESEISPQIFTQKKLARIYRHGKYLVYEFSEQTNKQLSSRNQSIYLVQHLRMTGKMLPETSPAIPAHLKRNPKKKLQLRAQFIFKPSPAPLLFYDTRRFGTLTGVKNIRAFWEKKNMAPDIYESRKEALAHWQQKCTESARPIKAQLLNQSAIAGVGNIYADESLHETRIHPLRKSNSLKAKETLAIFEALEKIFASAIQSRGSSVENYLGGNGKPGEFQNFLKVYQRGGKLCSSCRKTRIESLTIVGRSSWFCGKCQSLED